MAKKTERQIVNSLITKFINLYSESIGRKPIFSRYAEYWPMSDLYTDYSEQEITDAMGHFFKLSRSDYSIKTFYQKYHEITKGMVESERRRQERIKLLQETKRLVEESENER